MPSRKLCMNDRYGSPLMWGGDWSQGSVVDFGKHTSGKYTQTYLKMRTHIVIEYKVNTKNQAEEHATEI
ncbi:hypothetical protein E2C01_037620 [Portunus trituberculatus]|uniref:Uncharacterized protein n=1 Tax=Portunus trituberculatus TaxID=210409 RepID=A0A5B7F9U1_PORTR|nr:hypothetical protein [Portunus trituberculatus]